MKKWIALLLIATIILSMFSACAANKSSTAADTYLSMAEAFLDQGDRNAAMDILKKGYSETKDERLAVKLAELSTDDPESNDPTKTTAASVPEETAAQSATESTAELFVGLWSTEGFGWINGGMLLDINVEDGNLYLYISNTQSAPASRLAECMHVIPLAEVTGKELSFSFEEDGWGNSGTIQLVSGENKIDCNISLNQASSSAMWGFGVGSFELIRNDNAYNDLQYTTEEYNEYFGIEETVPNNSGVNANKTSGILAQLGVTEEEFRNSCRRLFPDGIQIGTPDGGEAYFSDLFEYPNNYVGNWFVIDNLGGYDFEVTRKGKTDDGTLYYVDSSSSAGTAMIIDCRDDPYSPTVREGRDITPYVIFMGLDDSGYSDTLVFWMLTFDKD